MTKKRVSMTLEEGLLKRADRLVGELDDTRSGVFEKLLGKAFLSLVPKTAVVLAGSGELLMREHGGKKLVDRHMESLGVAGVNRFVFVGSGMADIRDHLKGRGKCFFVNDQNSGTAGALKHAEHLLDNTFFLVYGDTVVAIDYQDLYRFHTSQQVMATVALTTSSEPQKFGVPEMKGTRITGFREKPSGAESYIISAGSFVIEPEVLELISKNIKSLEKNVLPKLASINQLAGYTFSGGWVDLGESAGVSSSRPEGSE